MSTCSEGGWRLDVSDGEQRQLGYFSSDWKYRWPSFYVQQEKTERTQIRLTRTLAEEPQFQYIILHIKGFSGRRMDV